MAQVEDAQPQLLGSCDELVNTIRKLIKGDNEVGFYIGGTDGTPVGPAKNPHGRIYKAMIENGTLKKINTFYIEPTQMQGAIKRELIDKFIENEKCMNGRRGEGRIYRVVYVTVSAVLNYKHRCPLHPDRQPFGSINELMAHIREHDTDPDMDAVDDDETYIDNI